MAITASQIWLDGKLVPKTNMGAPVMGHALQRGSLVFDVGAFHDTSRGPALFRARDHAKRFMRSINIVGLRAEVTEDSLIDAACQVIVANRAKEGLIRWSAFVAATESDIIPKDMRAYIVCAVQLLQDPPRTKPMTVATYDDARKAAPTALPPDAKAAAAYLGPMIAKRRAAMEGFDDVVLLDENGDIAEAPISNAFAVIDGTLWTPPLGRILPGITRATVLSIAREDGIPVREAKLTRSAFQNADEAFLSGTSLPLAPIGKIDNRKLEAPGPITKKLLDRVQSARRGGRPEWTTYVLERQNANASSK